MYLKSNKKHTQHFFLFCYFGCGGGFVCFLALDHKADLKADFLVFFAYFNTYFLLLETE